ncbi:hypothetical protein D0866_13532 [Hortaea werneckii]|uniref:Rhodopsin domain-containing protein n=1 Tax=Hortaea werneckii TaxID=91943 RepID=A0A3M6ZQ29_HORWE|nr:hypothetical protein D0866_13532 [Hortaea werneckii]
MPGNIINLTPADIAAWPTPNYDNPDEETWATPYAVIWYAASTLLLGLRLWLRFTAKAGNVGLDDILMIFAWIGSTLYTIVFIIGAEKYHTGRDMWDIPLTDYEGMAKVTWIAELAVLVCSGCCKISVLLFYRRLVGGTYDRSWMIAVFAAIGFTAAWAVAFIIMLFVNCSPMEAYWKAFDPTYAQDFSCLDTTPINLLSGIFACITDVYSVALPLLMTRNLKIPGPQKIALNLIFSAALLVVVASAVRTYYLYQVGHSTNVSRQIFLVFVWSHVELQLGLMCASAPALRVFFRSYLSGPISKAMDSSGLGKSRSGKLEGDSGMSGSHGTAGLKRLASHADDEAGVTHQRESKAVPVTETGYDDTESISPASSQHRIIRTPAEFEAYNMQNMERFRETALPKRPQTREGLESISADAPGLRTIWASESL